MEAREARLAALRDILEASIGGAVSDDGLDDALATEARALADPGCRAVRQHKRICRIDYPRRPRNIDTE